MKQKAIIITGAAGDIGQALCQSFDNSGYHIIASDLNIINYLPSHYSQVAVDLNLFCMDESVRHTALSDFSDALAGRPLAVLINNAATQIVKQADKLSLNDWQKTLNVNLTAPFLLSQNFLSQLQAANGTVINISSIHSTLTKPGFSAYATSKSALCGLTRSLALEYGHQVRFNAICPAAINTSMLEAGFEEKGLNIAELEKMHPVGRIGYPKDVAEMALYLASNAAGFINGAEIQLDGGIRSRLYDPD